ncbi:DUF3408 domain-containing protein [Prevotella fusca]
MEKKKTTDEEHDLSYYLGDNEKETSSKTTEQKDRFIPKWEEIRKQGNRTPVNQSGIPSENSEHELHVVLSQDAVPSQHTENSTVQRRISAKMRKETLEAYEQAYLVPTKLSDRKAVYLGRETQERADFIVRRLGDRGSNLSSFVENIVRLHLEEYGEDIEKWRRL